MKILFYFLIFLPSFSFATDWEALYKQTCGVDKMCGRLKDRDGTWLRPKPETIALLKDPEMQKAVNDAAKANGVSSLAVAAAIVTENSLNVGVKDAIQTFLARNAGITKIGTHSFTVGLGQIGIPAARDADDHAAALQHRKPRTDAELTKMITDPIESVTIAAEIMRKVQDDYKAQGFDISNQPEILATLYNLGNSAMHAAESKAAHRLPQVNYFGLFVKRYGTDIGKALNLNSATPSSVATTSTPQKNTITSASVSSALVKKSTAANVPKEKVTYATAGLPLIGSPLLCDDSKQEYGQDVASMTKSQSYGAPRGIISSGETYKEIGKSLDCNSEIWHLVTSGSGQTGWVKDADLEKVSSTRLDPIVKCGPGGNSDCAKKVLSSSKEYLINNKDPKDKTGLAYLKPVAAPKVTAGFDNEDFFCHNTEQAELDSLAIKNQVSSATGGYATPGVNPMWKAPAVLSVKDKEDKRREQNEVVKIVDSELARMEKGIGARSRDDLDGPENPYFNLAQALNQYRMSARNCVNSIDSEAIHCGYGADPKKLREFMSKVTYSKSPDFDKASSLVDELEANVASQNRISSNLSYAPSEDEKKAITPAQIKEALQICEDRLTKFENDYSAKLKAKNSTGSSSSGPACPSCYSSGTLFGLQVTDTEVRSILDKGKVLSDSDVEKSKDSLITIGRFCNARFNLIERMSNSNNSIVCAQAPKYLSAFGMTTIGQQVFVATIKNKPEYLLGDLTTQFLNSTNTDPNLTQLLYASMYAGKGAITPTVPDADDEPPAGSYCPNKTAEYIEQLVKDNPCIKAVYVPTRYLVNKLASSSNKIYYRKFDTQDRYAVDFGNGSCK